MPKCYQQSKFSSLLSSSAKITSTASPADYIFLPLSAKLQLQGVAPYYHLLLDFYIINWTLGGGYIYTNISSYNTAKLKTCTQSSHVVLMNISLPHDGALRPVPCHRAIHNKGVGNGLYSIMATLKSVSYPRCMNEGVKPPSHSYSFVWEWVFFDDVFMTSVEGCTPYCQHAGCICTEEMIWEQVLSADIFGLGGIERCELAQMCGLQWVHQCLCTLSMCPWGQVL